MTMSDYPNERECEHGLQRGKCEWCLDAMEIRLLRAECDAARALVSHLQAELAAEVAGVRQVEAERDRLRTAVEAQRQLVVRLDSLLSLLWYRPSTPHDAQLTMDVEEAIAQARKVALVPEDETP